MRLRRNRRRAPTISPQSVKEFVYPFTPQAEEKPLVPPIKWSQGIYLLPEGWFVVGHTTSQLIFIPLVIDGFYLSRGYPLQEPDKLFPIGIDPTLEELTNDEILVPTVPVVQILEKRSPESLSLVGEYLFHPIPILTTYIGITVVGYGNGLSNLVGIGLDSTEMLPHLV